MKNIVFTYCIILGLTNYEFRTPKKDVLIKELFSTTYL